jgi:hypothetical protein
MTDPNNTTDAAAQKRWRSKYLMPHRRCQDSGLGQQHDDLR